jgi:hypothetical protein
VDPFATPERNRYFAGQRLGVDDLTREQEYHRAASARTAWAAMGAGVVAGLGLAVADDGQGLAVTVEAGLAIDPLGREIVLPSAAALWPAMPPPFTIWIGHADVPGRAAPGPGGPEAATVREESTLEAVAGVPASSAGVPGDEVAALVRAGDVAGALALLAERRPLPAGATGVPLGSVVPGGDGVPVVDRSSRLTAVTAATLLPVIAELAEIVRDRSRPHGRAGR